MDNEDISKNIQELSQEYKNKDDSEMIPDQSEKSPDNSDLTSQNNNIKKGKDFIDNDDIIIQARFKENNELELINQNRKKQSKEEENQNNQDEDERHQEIPVLSGGNEPKKKVNKAKKLIEDKMKIPPRLFNTFIVTSILALLGLVLIIVGCIQSIAKHTPGNGIMFWVLGGIVMIPGGFYTYQFVKAKKAKDEYQREDILDKIPVL